VIDIHGCIIELKALLLKCNYQKGQDTVILAGDIVNGAPFSAEVVRYVMAEGMFRHSDPS
jgi:bis(5'-nucleosyl)-tetraphosphatase (symmetrical)